MARYDCFFCGFANHCYKNDSDAEYQRHKKMEELYWQRSNEQDDRRAQELQWYREERNKSIYDM